MKIEETIKTLENRSYTTKELTDLGISRYNINKLIEASILTRTSKGHYDCVLKQSEEASKYFYDFVKKVFKRNYDKAFKALKGNFDTRTVYEYDHHLKIYFTLLSKLTTDKVDLSFLSELEDTNKEITSAKDRIFNEFLKNLYADNMSVAFSYLKSFKEKEEALNGESTLSTKLFYNLLLAIKIKERDQKKELPKQEETYVSYGYLIKQFDYYLDNDMYSEALNIIDLIIEKAYPKYKDNYLKIKRMINTYLDLKNNKTVLPEIDISYPDTNDYSYIFNMALLNNDYQTALKNVGKLIYLNPNSKFLKQYRKLLFLISEINKENKKITEVVIPKVKEEDITAKYITSIDSEELYNLVYDAEHEKLYALLDSYFKNPNYERNRTFYNLYQMLQVLKDLSEDRYKPKHSDEIEISEFDSFGYFFEAMRKKNYLAAYNVVDACDKKNKERNNNNEFELYKYMLQDVIRELKRYEENKVLMEKIKELDSVIDTYIYHKGTYTIDEVNAFLKILEDKKTYMVDNYMDLSDDEEKLLSLLKTIINFDSFYGEFSEYFDHHEYTGTLVEQFNASMEYGDYPSSLEIITNQDWIDKTRYYPNRKYFEAYKKLLFTLKNSTELQPVKKENIEKTEFSEPEGITVLRKIKSFVKKNDYASAFITYVDSDLDKTNPELHIYLDIILKGLVNYQESESIVLLQQYKNAFNSGDTIKAKIYLDAYKKCIEQTGLDRELDYHYNRIDDLQNRINDDNFVLLENLFDAAKYYYEQHDYQNCIAKATEFIEQDNDRTAKCYLLRGRAYEYLKDFKQAESDYEKAVSISKEPNALFRLGRLAMYRSEYDGALVYWDQVRQRRNVFNKKITHFLKETYVGLNDSENAKKYQKRLNVFNRES